MLPEVNGNFWNVVISSENERSHEIISPVGPGLEAGNLRPCDDHGLAQVLQHERERRRRVRQGISSCRIK